MGRLSDAAIIGKPSKQLLIGFVEKKAMPGIVEIRDSNADGLLTVKLRDVLRVVEPEGRDLTWSILDLEARSDPDKFKGNLLEIEQKVRESPQGLIFTWDELVTFAHALIEVVDAVIVACKDQKLIPSLKPGDEVFAQCEFGIEAVDSSVWRVYARDDQLLQKVQAAFNDVNLIQ